MKKLIVITVVIGILAVGVVLNAPILNLIQLLIFAVSLAILGKTL